MNVATRSNSHTSRRRLQVQDSRLSNSTCSKCRGIAKLRLQPRRQTDGLLPHTNLAAIHLRPLSLLSNAFELHASHLHSAKPRRIHADLEPELFPHDAQYRLLLVGRRFVRLAREHVKAPLPSLPAASHLVSALLHCEAEDHLCNLDGELLQIQEPSPVDPDVEEAVSAGLLVERPRVLRHAVLDQHPQEPGVGVHLGLQAALPHLQHQLPGLLVRALLPAGLDGRVVGGVVRGLPGLVHVRHEPQRLGPAPSPRTGTHARGPRAPADLDAVGAHEPQQVEGVAPVAGVLAGLEIRLVGQGDFIRQVHGPRALCLTLPRDGSWPPPRFPLHGHCICGG
mmetsp:Transcript_20277/g.47889  ORF Transcript_20277/g.47889 Transcript_20277/m.47889 type:complete len:338 (+) Transcript_20277:3-1016(+)